VHTCNPWCFDGLHALLFETSVADWAPETIGPVTQALARQAGYLYVGWSAVQATGAPRPGTPTPAGVARGRAVVWAKERGK
jgi:hypothetical protein